jgi:hypothetical protein
MNPPRGAGEFTRTTSNRHCRNRGTNNSGKSRDNIRIDNSKDTRRHWDSYNIDRACRSFLDNYNRRRHPPASHAPPIHWRDNLGERIRGYPIQENSRPDLILDPFAPKRLMLIAIVSAISTMPLSCSYDFTN